MTLPLTPSQTIRPFFAEAEANAVDPLLCSIRDPEVRARLVAVAEAGGGFGFDLWLQGEWETPFLAL